MTPEETAAEIRRLLLLLRSDEERIEALDATEICLRCGRDQILHGRSLICYCDNDE